MSDLGSTAVDRPLLDNLKQWTFVSYAPITADGEIREYELFSGHGNRELSLGIYRPSGKECQFRLVQQVALGEFEPGYHRVSALMFHSSHLFYVLIVFKKVTMLVPCYSRKKQF